MVTPFPSSAAKGNRPWETPRRSLMVCNPCLDNSRRPGRVRPDVSLEPLLADTAFADYRRPVAPDYSRRLQVFGILACERGRTPCGRQLDGQVVTKPDVTPWRWRSPEYPGLVAGQQLGHLDG